MVDDKIIVDPMDEFIIRWEKKIDEIKAMSLSPEQAVARRREFRIEQFNLRYFGGVRNGKYSQNERYIKFDQLDHDLRISTDLAINNYEKNTNKQEIKKLKSKKGLFDGIKNFSLPVKLEILNFFNRRKK